MADDKSQALWSPGAMEQQRMSAALASLRRADVDSVHEGLNELAALAAFGFEPALRPLLQQMLDRRLAERAVRRVLLNPADIDDAVQATLIAVAEHVSEFQGRSRFTTWVETIARNEALMVIRRQQRKSEPSSNELPESDQFAKRLSSLVADQEALRVALSQLSPEHREVLVLREDQGLTYDEIAARLATPVGTVRSRINRARRTLAEFLLA